MSEEESMKQLKKYLKNIPQAFNFISDVYLAEKKQRQQQQKKP